jgi:O-antigen/teichoic acid export membrane protein
VLIWVGVWTGFTQSAAFRGGQLLFGPIQLLLNSLRLAVTPIAVRAYRQRDLDAVRRFGVGISAGALLISLFWGGALVALPASAGHLILGRSWAAARSALIPFWCLTAGFAFGFGALVMLRAMAAIRTSFKIRLTSAVATFCIGGAAALGGSVPAATSGATVVTFTSLAMWRRAWQISNDERHSSRQTGGAAGDVHAESTAVGGDLPARPHGRHSPDPGPNAGQGGHIAPSGAGSS